MRFNPPPNWPVQPGWIPPPGWRPPAEWGEPPYGWSVWVDDEPDRTEPITILPAHLSDDSEKLPSDRTAESPNEPDLRAKSKELLPKQNLGIWRKAAENPIWTTLGALVGIVGLVISMVQVVQAMQTPPVDLEVAALTIDGQVPAKGTLDGSDTKANRSIALTPIDLTLQNKGGLPSLITRIDAEIVFFRQLRDCTSALSSSETISAKYQLPIPMNGLEPAAKQLSTEIRFEVKPGAADRMIFSLGPQTQPEYETTPMVMSARIKLVHDEDQVLDVGTVSLVTTVAAAMAQIDALGLQPSDDARACANDNVKDLDEMFAIQATRSRLLDSLRSAYQQASA